MTVPAGVFDFNPNDVVTGIPVYEKGSYELEVGEPKAFYRQGKAQPDGKVKDDNYGVFYKCKIVGGKNTGKPYIVNCYMHTPESQAFSKAFLMAANGFKPRDNDSEAAFNAKLENANWKFSPQDKSAGDAWHTAKNQHLIVDLDVTLDKDGEKQQKLIGYRPLSSQNS